MANELVDNKTHNKIINIIGFLATTIAAFIAIYQHFSLKAPDSSIQPRTATMVSDGYTPTPRSPYDVYLDRGQKCINDNNYDCAFQNFNDAITITPKDRSAYWWLGYLYYKDKKIDLAIENFKKSADLSHENVGDDSFFYLGLIYRDYKNYPQSIEYFTESIRRGRTNPDVYCIRAHVREKLTQNIEAIKDYQDCQKLAYIKNDEYYEYYKNNAEEGLLRLGVQPSASVDVVKDGQPILIFSESFDDNHNGWNVEADSDFNSNNYKASKYLENGRYYRKMESNDKFTAFYGIASAIPSISEKNFCLVFDASIVEAAQKLSIDISARSANGGPEYAIDFYSNGDGEIWLLGSSTGDKLLGNWQNGIVWDDKQIHTVKVSFQDSEIAVYDGQNDRLLQKINPTDENLVLQSGNIFIGSGLFSPNQRSIVEFDNIFVYDRCP